MMGFYKRACTEQSPARSWCGSEGERLEESPALVMFNHLLITTVVKNGFPHPVNCCFISIHWMNRGLNTLNEALKVLSTGGRPLDSINTSQFSMDV
jgi:hypothetical protein